MTDRSREFDLLAERIRARYAEFRWPGMTRSLQVAPGVTEKQTVKVEGGRSELMDKMDDLKAELRAMERIAKILHELPSADSLIRVSAWLRQITEPDQWMQEVKEANPPADNPLALKVLALVESEKRRAALAEVPDVPKDAFYAFPTSKISYAVVEKQLGSWSYSELIRLRDTIANMTDPLPVGDE